MFETMLLTGICFPVTMVLLGLGKLIQERRGIEKFDVIEGAGQLIVPAKRKAKTTQKSLISMGFNKEVIDGFRRVLIAQRKQFQKTRCEEMVMVLTIAEMRRTGKKLSKMKQQEFLAA